MKKSTVTMTYDEERLNAIRLFLSQKNLDLDVELNSFFDSLFKKVVPSDVRRFLEMKDGCIPDKSSRSSPKETQPK